MAERNDFPLPRGPCQSASEGRSNTWRANKVNGAVCPAQTGREGIRMPVKCRTQSPSSLGVLGMRLRTASSVRAIVTLGFCFEVIVIFIFVVVVIRERFRGGSAGQLVGDGRRGGVRGGCGSCLTLKPGPDLLDGPQIALNGLI